MAMVVKGIWKEQDTIPEDLWAGEEVEVLVVLFIKMEGA